MRWETDGQDGNWVPILWRSPTVVLSDRACVSSPADRLFLSPAQQPLKAGQAGARLLFWFPTWVWAFVPWLLAVAAAGGTALSQIAENDLSLHVLLGRDILTRGRLTGDPTWLFGSQSSGPLASWRTTTPAAEVLFAWIDSIGAARAFAVVTTLCVIVFVLGSAWALGQVAARSRRSPGAARSASLALLLLCIGVVPQMGARPQTVAFVLVLPFAVWAVRLLATGSIARPGRPHALAGLTLVTLAWAWACLHGSVVVAIGALGIALAIYALARLGARVPLARVLGGVVPSGLWIVAAGLATLATPAGLATWTRGYAVSRELTGLIPEWSPLTTSDLHGWTLAGLLMLWLWGAYAWRKTCRLPWRSLLPEAAFLTVLLVLCWPHSRTVLLVLPIVALVAGRRAGLAARAVLPRAWETLPAGARWRRGLPSLLAGVLAAECVLAAVMGAWAPGRTPESLWRALADEPGQRRVVVWCEFGAQALYFTPEGKVQVASDGRMDRFSADYLARLYSLMHGGDEWQATMAVDYPDATDIVVHKSMETVANFTEAGWRVTATDGDFVLLSRPTPA